MTKLSQRNTRVRGLTLSPPPAPETDTFDRLPDHLRSLVSPVDPDFHVICDSIELMRLAGFEVATPEGLATCIEAGRRRARKLAAQAAPEIRAFQRQQAEEYRAASVADLERRSRVYYARSADLVKIGYTTNIPARMSSLCPEELLAIEPGGPQLEHERHQQFIDLHVRGEWFRYEDALVDHVAGLRLKQETLDLKVSAPKTPAYSDGRRLTTAEAAHLAGVAQATIRGWGSKPRVPVKRYSDGWDMEEILAYRNTRYFYRTKPLNWAG